MSANTDARPWRWLVAGAAVLVAVAVAVLVLRPRDPGTPTPAATGAVTTTELQRRDLSTSKSISGTIGYGGTRAVDGHKQATVTWLPAPGTTVKRGRQLYRADDLPVPLFYGGMPLYRTITGKGLAGRDVRIIADNLKALGYPIGVQPDTKPVQGAVLTPQLIAAIKRWQRDQGLPETGAIAVGDVEVLAGAVRVESVAVQPGAPATGPLMSVTATRKVITVAADVSEAASIERGAAVTVVLPDERTVPGRVLSVGRVLAAADGAVADATPKLTITVTLKDPKAIAKIDAAEVRVDFAGKVRENVLAAPVEALVALAEGGYAVQTTTGLVAVTTGMFAQGWVEITGDGLTEGTSVVVAS
ncbi:peptidoglycan-binding protein [Actinoplanes lobatus]|uniref:Peptidoglycan hydrolase-like protein with peptidoglycan-binding domain n=1 Tax=Actinoplanes lobatus TaxID=113568 RepID=A0A7W7HJV8_9ACTN|nr:peptidoglycan-binding protein [Actinoplanes lobatus]MBB4751840.1 peptidoglycan hydrolase-like protein with peptidoglycan-binding domain [Actinoplanes lobatus]GGN97274.1 peptidoglycan-binding protein [Actinoplanes lobatus]GIE45683.1 peptidoglycan-binding protein [Actinoplanes lobatus]